MVLTEGTYNKMLQNSTSIPKKGLKQKKKKPKIPKQTEILQPWKLPKGLLNWWVAGIDLPGNLDMPCPIILYTFFLKWK